MGSNPPPPPYDPMTPSLEDYNKAQGEAKLANQHYAYVHKQSADKTTISEAAKDLQTKTRNMDAIRDKLRKAGKMK